MMNLDSQAVLEKLDTGKILASIRLLPDQMEQAWEEIKNIKLPKSYKEIDNLVVGGMGGSALGGRIIDSLLDDRVLIPIEVFNQYNVPKYTNSKTLFIASSYSGNTEEAISMYEQAVEKKAKVFGITTGGRLAQVLERDGKPSYIYSPKANPSGQPRMGLGYSIIAPIALLAKLGLIQLVDDEFYKAVVEVRKLVRDFEPHVPSHTNMAKVIAGKLYRKVIVLIASGHLVGATHAFKNQLNENSKAFSVLFDLPELNHHLLEGLRFPIRTRDLFHFVIIKSDFYKKDILERVKLTDDVIEKNGFECTIYPMMSRTKLLQIFETVVFGSFVSFYLAMLYGINPSEIPWVDYFKQKLAKS